MSPADTSAPRLTVFTTFYREIDYLDETIRSVLAQTFRDFEYLIINDGDPATAQSIEQRYGDPRIRIITNPRPLGIRASRNAGLHEARGELIAFIDSDDFCSADRFEKQVAFLDAHPDHVLVGSSLRYVNERSEIIGGRSYPVRDEDIRPRMIVLNCIAQPSVMARRKALIDAGGYSPRFEHAEDYDLWLRAARLGRLHNLPEPLLAYRIHTGAGKLTRLRPALRDSTRLKIHALRHYGYPLTLRAALSVIVHAALQLLPDRLIFWLFRLAVVG